MSTVKQRSATPRLTGLPVRRGRKAGVSTPSLGHYALRRLGLLIPQLFVVITLAFILIRIIPGDPAANLLGGAATQDAIDQLRAQYGLDQPIYVQYFAFLGGLLRGDLGISWRTSQAVTLDIAARLPVTLQLIGLAMFFSFVIAVAMSVWLSRPHKGRQQRAGRSVARVYGLLAGAMPEFWLALLLLLLFYVWLGVAPAPFGLLSSGTTPPTPVTGFLLLDTLITGNTTAFLDVSAHFLLPVLALVFVTVAPLLKMTWSELSHAFDSEYVRFFQAMGAKRRTIYRYALQSVSAPVLTLAGVQTAMLLGNAVLIERIFSLGGFAQYGVDSVLASDYPGVLGFVTVAGAFAFIVYLVVDLIQAALDPRVR